MIETLANFRKGISGVTTQSKTGRNFCTVVKFALKKLDKVYHFCKAEVRDVLARELAMSFELENYQKVLAKRMQTENQCSITYRATSSSIMRNKIPMTPVGTIMF